MKYAGPGTAVLTGLLDTLRLPHEESRSSLRLHDHPPVLVSPHRVSLAGSLALLAQGASVAWLWEQRGGRPQEVWLDARDAVFAVNPFPWLRRNGHPALEMESLRSACDGYFPTRDGRTFFITAGGYPRLLDATLRALGCPPEHDAVAAAVARRDGEELERAFIAGGATGGLVRSRAEWLAHPHGRVLMTRPLIKIEPIGASPPVRLEPAGRPLDGIRVGDLTHVIAGPVVSRGLAEQGADVLHLGPIHPKLVDPIGMVIATGMGKRSATIDFARGDAGLLESLLRDADVFVQSWRPGMLEAHGFAPAELAATRPGIISVSISCYGLDGPWSGRGGFDPLAAASTGMTADEARHDTLKVTPPGMVIDSIAGFLGTAAIAATLARRARDGGSWHISISLARVAMWIQSLGLHPDGTPADPHLGPPFLWRMESPFGTLDYVPPALRYSETIAYFDKPPVPVGASQPAWLTRPRH